MTGSRAGNNIAARMAIIAITTSNSISVNPLLRRPHSHWRAGAHFRTRTLERCFIGNGTQKSYPEIPRAASGTEIKLRPEFQ
jgi:hypothetical protein